MSKTPSLSRRRLLQGAGLTALVGAAYHPGVLGGLFRVPAAVAQERPDLPAGFGVGRRVAVIGAGIAGLTATYELMRAGFTVDVYEGDNRYGGRSLTVRPNDPDYRAWAIANSRFLTEDTYVGDIPAEVRGAENPAQTAGFVPAGAPVTGYFELHLNAGPGRIPLFHTGILHYCREFGVEMDPYIFVSESNRLQAAGLNGGAPVQIREFGYNMQGYLGEMLYGLEQGGLDPNETAQFRDFLTAYGDLEDGRFAGTERAGYVVDPGAGLNPGLPRTPLAFEEILEARGVWPGLLNASTYEWQTSLLEPAGGMDMIWHAFLQQRPAGPEGERVIDRVRLNHRVTGLSYRAVDGTDLDSIEGAGGVRLSLLTPDGAVEATADFVIMTGQPHFTAQMQTDGILAEGVRHHLESVLYSNGGKYGWQGRTRFWESPETQIFGGISWTTHQIEQIWYPSQGYNGPTGILTGGYIHDKHPVDAYGAYYQANSHYSLPVDPALVPAHERNAGRWAQMTLQARTEQALIGGEALHPGFTEHVYADRGLSISWDNQPFQLGIGTQNMPKTRPAAYDRLIRPIDRRERVYLAGDYLSYWSGWQEGSVRSVWWTLGLLRDRINADAG